MKNIKISEEQDRLIKEMISGDINEMLNPNASVGNNNKFSLNITSADGSAVNSTDVRSAFDKVANNPTTEKMPVSVKTNIGGDTYKVFKSSDNTKNISESYLVSKKQVRSMQLRKLKENSTVIKRKDFIE